MAEGQSNIDKGTLSNRITPRRIKGVQRGPMGLYSPPPRSDLTSLKLKIKWVALTPKSFLTKFIFPLPFVPKLSYRTGGRRFGSSRKGGRLHAGCDLIAPKRTKIYAVDDGTVIRRPYYFYRGTYALEVQYGKFIVRYGEILRAAPGIRAKTPVKKGQVIAYVGKMRYESMLHFEMYDGTAKGPLTQRYNSKSKYQRRDDLIDPTPYLDSASKASTYFDFSPKK